MPRGDRTGPEGMGPMTGRGMGYCSGYPAPGYGRGRGFYRMGMAFRRGWGNWRRPAWGPAYGWEPDYEPVDERELLEQEAGYLKRQLDAVQDRLNKLEGNSE